MPTKVVEQSSPNKVLREWLKSHGISLAQCTRDMGYKSNYVFLLLSPNPAKQRPVTYEVIGRLLYTYGISGPALRMIEAMKASATSANGKGGKS